MTQQLSEEEKKAQIVKRVRRMRDFYTTLITFFFVNLLLLAINLLSNPHHLWFYWVTVIWGIVIIFQAINVFTIRNPVLGEEWEKQKIEKLLDKESRKNKSKEGKL